MHEPKLRRVHFIRSWWFAAVTLLVAGPASAQTWRVDYDPALGTLPSAQGWTHFVDDPAPVDGLSEANYSVAAGALTQGQTGGINADIANRQWYEHSLPSFDFDDDVIQVDLRVRIVSSTSALPPSPSPRAGFGVTVMDVDRQRVTLYFGTNGLFLYGSDGATSAVIPFDTTAGFEDYRLRIDEYGASVRIDDVQFAHIPRNYFGSVTTPNRILFGDLTILEQSNSQLESISFGRFNPSVGEVRSYERTVQNSSSTGSEDAKGSDSQCLVQPASGVLQTLLTSGVQVLPTSAYEFTTLVRRSPTFPSTAVGFAIERIPWSGDWLLKTHAVCGEFPGLEHVSETVFPNPSLPTNSVSVICPAGKLALSGGAWNSVSNGPPEHPRITQDTLHSVLGVPSGWTMTGEQEPHAGLWGQRVYAVCGDQTHRAIVTGVSSNDATPTRSAIAVCPDGNVVIGGGGSISGTPDRGRLVASYPSVVFDSTPVAWIVEAAANTIAVPSDWQVSATAICVPRADSMVWRHRLVGRWRADSGYPIDEQGRNDGTLVNGATIENGFWDKAFSFDEANDEWLSIPSDDFYPSGSFSVSAFFQTSTMTGAPAWIASLYNLGGINVGPANYSHWFLRLTAEGFAQVSSRQAQFPNAVSVTGTDVLTDGNPHHIALVRDVFGSDRRLELWVDGIRIGFEPLTVGLHDGAYYPSAAGDPDPISVGVLRESGTTNVIEGFDGLIDDLQFHERALTREEVENTAGCVVPILPRMLNLDASRFGGPSGASFTQRLCAYLEPGDYTVTLTSPSENPLARFTAWSDSGTGNWGTAYLIVSDSTAVLDGSGLPLSQSNMQAAFDSTLEKTYSFSLPFAERVYFSVEDDITLDNQGGVSLLLQVPEPGFGATLLSGIALLGVLGRRHRRRK